MPFHSPQFLFFLPVVLLAYALADPRYRWLVLLAGSYLFYAALGEPALLTMLAAITVTAYACGLAMASSRLERLRPAIFWTGVVIVLGILVGLKYVPSMAHGIGLSVLVTIGVSYFTFQAISYLADVYLGIQDPEGHLGYLALYMAFFPKLLQGPIERAGTLIPQLRDPAPFSFARAREALLLFVWGLFKKVVIADRLALYVDDVYGNVHAHNGLPLLMATYLFAWQIYFDFSGYTDMALGIARLFGIRLTANFNAPYAATSIADFWRRWHISFSRWIHDYAFRPMQIMLRDWGSVGLALALVVTFLLCGLWHGPGWNFALWGLLFGIYMAASAWTAPLRKRLIAGLGIGDSLLRTAFQIGITFNLVCLAWVFFRANTVGDALYVITHLFTAVEGTGAFLLSRGRKSILFVLAAVTAVSLVSWWDSESLSGPRFRRLPAVVRWSTYYALVLSVLFALEKSSPRFIYFQF